jgi:hypothetical protein
MSRPCSLPPAQVLGALVTFALDQPQTQPLKAARREFFEGQGVGCAGDRSLGLGQGPPPVGTGRERGEPHRLST